MYPRNAASPEPVAIGAVVQISDGAVQTSGCTVRIKPIGVAEADGGGTTAYSTDGIVLYTPTQAETNYTSFVLIAKKTGCIPVAITVVTSASATAGYAGTDQSKITNATSTVNLSGTTIKTATDVETDTADIQSRIPAALTAGGNIKADVLAISGDATAADNLEAALDGTGGVTITAAVTGNITGNLSGSVGSVTAGVTVTTNNDKTGYSLTATTGLGNQTANITGSLSGSVGSVTGAVGSVTGNVGGNVVGSVGSVTGAVGSVTGNVGGNVTGSVGSIATGGIAAASFAEGAIDAAAIAANAIGASELAADAVAKIQSGLSTLTAADVRTAVGLASANLDTQLAAIAAYIDTEVSAIKAKTDNLPAAPAATGDIPTVSQIWTTALTEAYRGTGATGTAAQLLYEILQNLTEFAISSTTKTVKKLDGSTTAKTYTLNSATTPTSITEAT